MGVNIDVWIPIYQAEGSIFKVIEEIDSFVWTREIKFNFIDNMSVDSTILNCIEALNKSKLTGVRVWQNPANIGLGGSQKLAFKLSIQNGMDFVAIFHGDGQPKVSDLREMIKVAETKKFDAVLGARFKKGAKLIEYNQIRKFNSKSNIQYSIPHSCV
jgi:hypothetical protein